MAGALFGAVSPAGTAEGELHESQEQDPVRATSANILFTSAGKGTSEVDPPLGSSLVSVPAVVALVIVVLLLFAFAAAALVASKTGAV